MSSEATSSLIQTIATWGGGAAGLVGTVALLRRRLSRDSTEMTKDRAESTIVELLLKERDEAIADARDAWAARAANTEAIARLTAQNAHQAMEIQRLTREMATFRRMLGRLYPDTRQFLGTDFAPMQDPGP